MYLKTLEIVGFKSFAHKTRLEFEPGITAIVGPNGCGKSNVCDAIRWVLGEQRARALRGAKMEDVIFNGTDSHKPLGMAEVSITLADCAKDLGVEFDEVCITRRVFRSGESAYFINRRPCRLKDIQRLFMDTGIGTDAYSILEQGRIDRILSSRPEERRAVFEEAGGITKYKADRKEALRKLEHTEANLLRLADVIREVKRQIISLQRQAGKARRYKQLSAELRTLDLFLSRERLAEFEEKLGACERRLEETGKTVDRLHGEVEAAENATAESRRALAELEEKITQAMEEASAAQGELERTRSLIAMNTDRIAELEELARRNTRETEEAEKRLETHRAELQKLKKEIAEARDEKERAAAELQKALAAQEEAEKQLREKREALSRLREEALALESRISRLQNELNELDARERAALIKRERLAAEKKEMERALASFLRRKEKMDATVRELEAAVAEQKRRIEELSADRRHRREALAEEERKRNERLNRLAALRGRFEMLDTGEARSEGFPPGAQRLLDEKTRPEKFGKLLLGPLAEQVRTEARYRPALEAALRAALDAVIVRDADAARRILTWLRAEKAGSARLLAADAVEAPPPPPKEAEAVGRPLLDCIRCTPEAEPLFRKLLWNVRVVESDADLPKKTPPGTTVVSCEGTLLSADGRAELWMPETEDRSPLARHQLREQLAEEIAALEKEVQQSEERIERLRSEGVPLEKQLTEAEKELETLRRKLALQQGERQVIARETDRARKRVETVTFELESLSKGTDETVALRTRLAGELQQKRDRLAAVRERIAEGTRSLAAVEETRSAALSVTTEARITHSQCSQVLEHLLHRLRPLEARIREIEELITERRKGVDSYTRRREELEKALAEARAKIDPLEKRLEQARRTLDEHRARRDELRRRLAESEERLRRLRGELEAALEQKSKIELERAELAMRRDNLVERVTSAYRVTVEEIAEAEPPEWPDGRPPPREAIETRIAELRAKLDAMGPVNLVAIEEHAELEERFAFLNRQQEDLLAAKQQLLDLIKTINATSTRLFKETFDKVNENFQRMFKRLFGGGSAKLVLTDEEDVLESGVEIIARPPGKKLQSISLLSGGERTMTAVALLFALFLVKPSPFCVLDELDAALDDANINRFVDTLRDFLQYTQFIIITHSRQTIAAADVIYGVTMETRGISKIVSMKFSDYRETERAGKG